MNRDRRLRKTRDFAAVRRAGRSWSDGRLLLVARRNDLEKSRTGFAVGKPIGNAVVRNRLKRRMREAVRLTPVQNGWDLVFIARRGSGPSSFDSMVRSVTLLCKRAGILDAAQDGDAMLRSKV